MTNSINSTSLSPLLSLLSTTSGSQTTNSSADTASIFSTDESPATTTYSSDGTTEIIDVPINSFSELLSYIYNIILGGGSTASTGTSASTAPSASTSSGASTASTTSTAPATSVVQSNQSVSTPTSGTSSTDSTQSGTTQSNQSADNTDSKSKGNVFTQIFNFIFGNNGPVQNIIGDSNQANDAVTSTTTTPAASTTTTPATTVTTVFTTVTTTVTVTTTTTATTQTSTSTSTSTHSRPSHRRRDPIGFSVNGQRYELASDENGDGKFSGIDELVGYNNDWQEMLKFDTNDDGKISGSELNALKLVSPNGSGIKSASELGLTSIDLSSYKNNSFNVTVGGKTIKGTQTYESISTLNRQYRRALNMSM